MKKILKFLFLFLFFIFSLIYLFPKENLYFFVEKKLQNYKIVISNETINFNLSGVVLKNFDLYYDGIKIAKVESLNIKYSLFDFDKIQLSSQSKELGSLKGVFDLIKLKLDVALLPKKDLKDKYSSLLKQFKMKNGAYLYEYKL
ncbi:hypothetical protein [Halarcobacter anaerophilus]|uniref:hypothetical protein n=1 Tax=Halarcobacter anaerophilus TaxID=877500 RepID=UPI0005C98AC9|nr:hypothetical protein [Halarcobacter anaerophilus]